MEKINIWKSLLIEATTSGRSRQRQKLLRNRPGQKRKLARKRKLNKGCPKGSRFSLKHRTCRRVEPIDSINRMRRAVFRRAHF